MNICLKCQSAYEKPGTCNCYAEKPAQETAPTQPVTIPFYPATPYQYPYTTAPAYPWWLYQTTCDATVTYTGGSKPVWVRVPPSDPSAPVSVYAKA